MHTPDSADTADSAESDGPAPASVVIERRVEWSDTDAAGHQHFSTALRWAEAAEAVLLGGLGLRHLFGSTPRVHFEADYLRRLWFGETVRVELRVAKVGVSSLHYAFEVRGPEGVAATGRMVIAYAPVGATGTTPWPDDMRTAFTRSGPQPAEVYASVPPNIVSD